jgi:hypothetical protein
VQSVVPATSGIKIVASSSSSSSTLIRRATDERLVERRVADVRGAVAAMAWRLAGEASAVARRRLLPTAGEVASTAGEAGASSDATGSLQVAAVFLTGLKNDNNVRCILTVVRGQRDENVMGQDRTAREKAGSSVTLRNASQRQCDLCCFLELRASCCIAPHHKPDTTHQRATDGAEK